jgi:hydrophobic/amphiphilic exporter-1 (mainly G- bacteria), HAE1 family
MIRAAIRRPTAVGMVLGALSLLGGMAWVSLPLEILPETRLPRMTLEVEWPGSAPESMEALVTSPLEAAVRGARGVTRIASTTVEGRALLEVEFSPRTASEVARLELSERVAALDDVLPPGVLPVRIRPFVPPEFEREATRPFLLYLLSGSVGTEGLTHFAEGTIRPALLGIPGVVAVEVHGARHRLLQIELGRDLPAHWGRGLAEQLGALAGEQEVGGVHQHGRAWGLVVTPPPLGIAEVEALQIVGPGRNPVRLGAIAGIRDTWDDPPIRLRRNGEPGVAFTVHREPGTHAPRLARVVQSEIGVLAAARPPGTEIQLEEDLSAEIHRHLRALRDRAGFGIAVTALILRVSLGSSGRAGLLLVAVGASGLTTALGIAGLGMSLNLLTLMGLALGLGMIVDNAIVVLENILRRIRAGDSPPEAAERGAREVVFPVLASTLTTLVACFPFLYLQGELQRFYLPMVLALGTALVSSCGVAFTLIPSWTARGEGAAPEKGGWVFPSGGVERCLRAPWRTVGVSLLLLGVSGALIPSQVRWGGAWSSAAREDRSSLRIQITLPRGADLEEVDRVTGVFENLLRTIPEVERFTTQLGGGTSYTVVEFLPTLESSEFPRILEGRLQAFALGFTGAEVRVFGQGPAFFGADGRAPPSYQVTLLGYNYRQLEDLANDLGRRLARNPRVMGVDAQAIRGFASGDRAVEVIAEVDREAALRSGLSVAEGVSQVQSFLPETRDRGALRFGADPLPFEVRWKGSEAVDRNTLLAGAGGGEGASPTPPRAWIRLGERPLPGTIWREDQQYARTVSWEFRGPARLGDAVRDAALQATVLPTGFRVLERSPGRKFAADRRMLAGVFVLSLALVFCATAALFESVRQPLCVLASVPLGWIGGFGVFVAADATFTREAGVGLVLLGGIGVNNAILLVDHINRTRAAGVGELVSAITRATQERARPILMTTATTLGGIVPLVFAAPTPDAAPWSGIAYVLAGGILASTVATLTVTPALYLLLERGRAGEA